MRTHTDDTFTHDSSLIQNKLVIKKNLLTQTCYSTSTQCHKSNASLTRSPRPSVRFSCPARISPQDTCNKKKRRKHTKRKQERNKKKRKRKKLTVKQVISTKNYLVTHLHTDTQARSLSQNTHTHRTHLRWINRPPEEEYLVGRDRLGVVEALQIPRHDLANLLLHLVVDRLAQEHVRLGNLRGTACKLQSVFIRVSGFVGGPLRSLTCNVLVMLEDGAPSHDGHGRRGFLHRREQHLLAVEQLADGAGDFRWS